MATAAVGLRLVPGHSTKPLFAESFRLPTARDIDRRLVAGAVLFGVGWGLVGLCPGPALADLGLAFRPAAVFVAAMIAGMALFKLADRGSKPVPEATGSPGGLRGGTDEERVMHEAVVHRDGAL